MTETHSVLKALPYSVLSTTAVPGLAYGPHEVWSALYLKRPDQGVPIERCQRIRGAVMPVQVRQWYSVPSTAVPYPRCTS